MNNESSDEKLLKLIEGTSQVPNISKVARVGLKQSRIRFKFPFSKAKFFPRINLVNLNRLFYVISAVLTVVLLYNLTAGSPVGKFDFLLGGSGKGAVNGPKIFEDKAVLSLQEYLDYVEKKNIFLPKDFYEKNDQVDPDVLSNLVKDLKLVGVIWSAKPEVMIEDTFENRTFLLKKGEMFGQAKHKIKDITRNSVVLEILVSGKVQEYELR